MSPTRSARLEDDARQRERDRNDDARERVDCACLRLRARLPEAARRRLGTRRCGRCEHGTNDTR